MNAKPARISDFCDEFFAYLTLFKRTAGTSGVPYEEFRRQIHAYLAEMDRGAAIAAIPGPEYEASKYALVGLVDEMVLSSDWIYRDEWQRKPLQMELYGTLEAGDVFFEKLDALQPGQQAALEIFYLCLMFGFVGRYHSDPERIAHYKQKIHALLAPLKVGTEQKLTPGAYTVRAEGGTATLGALPSWWLVSGLALGAFVVVWLLYVVIISFSAGSAADRLRGILSI